MAYQSVTIRRKKPLPRKRKRPRREVVERTDEGFREFVRGQPCILLGSPREHRCSGPSRACHVKVRRHGDAENLYPGCDSAHTGTLGEHNMGRGSFQEYWGVDLHGTALRLWAEYQGEDFK